MRPLVAGVILVVLNGTCAFEGSTSVIAEYLALPNLYLGPLTRAICIDTIEAATDDDPGEKMDDESLGQSRRSISSLRQKRPSRGPLSRFLLPMAPLGRMTLSRRLNDPLLLAPNR